MKPADLLVFRRALENLKFESKTHLTRQEIDRLVNELTLSREYDLADYVRGLDPATIAALLR
jgi:hypothetical protein